MVTPHLLDAIPVFRAPRLVHVHCPTCRKEATVALPPTWVMVDLEGWKCGCGGSLEVQGSKQPEDSTRTVH